MSQIGGLLRYTEFVKTAINELRTFVPNADSAIPATGRLKELHLINCNCN